MNRIPLSQLFLSVIDFFSSLAISDSQAVYIIRKVTLTTVMCLLCLNPAFAIPGNTLAPDSFPLLKIFTVFPAGDAAVSSGILAHYKGLPMVVMSQHSTLDGSNIGSRFFIAKDNSTTLETFFEDLNDGYLTQDYIEINTEGGLWRASGFSRDSLNEQVPNDVAMYRVPDETMEQQVSNDFTRVDIPETLDLNSYTDITLYGSGDVGNRPPGFYQYSVDANRLTVGGPQNDILAHEGVITVPGDSGGPIVGTTLEGGYELIGTVVGPGGNLSFFSIFTEETAAARTWDCEV